MIIQLSRDLKQQCFEFIHTHAEQNEIIGIKYLDLGVTIIRVICYTEKIIPIMNKQLTYVLRDEMSHYDSTVVVWEEDSGKLATEFAQKLSSSQKMQLRAEMLWSRKKHPSIQVADENGLPIIKLNVSEGVTESYDEGRNTVYYGVDNFEPEKFVKHGHCFVQIINRLVKTGNVNLTHGAVFGYKGYGFLLCGRGKRGKSTLTIQSLLHGFEYVSDDYQILAKCKNELLAYPIYSIVTLSYRMYNEMYDNFKGKFVCNNFSQDKYLFNISAYHSQFRSAYPIRMCIFPEIVADKRPSIVACTPEEKGRAIVHLLHSTTVQMNELGDTDTIRKLFYMVKDLPFYKFNLCDDIEANTKYLQEFLCKEENKSSSTSTLSGILSDITFGLATFLNTDTFKFYAMNKFATNVYQLLCMGIEANDIRVQLENYVAHNPDIMKEFSALQRVIKEYNFYIEMEPTQGNTTLNHDFAEKSGYHMSIQKYEGNKPHSIL